MTQTRKNSSLSQTINVSTSGNGDTISIPSSGIVNISGVLNVNNISVSVSGHTHTSSDITNFNSSVSGILPVTSIVAGSNIGVTASGSVFTVAVTGQLGLTTEEVDDRISNLLVAGTGISLNYNDNSNTLTINTTGLQPSGNYSLVGHTHQGDDITILDSSENFYTLSAGNYAANFLARLIDGGPAEGFEYLLTNNIPISQHLLPRATASGLGIVQAGSGVSISSGIISVNTNYASLSHTHNSSDITNFNSSISGLVSGIYAPLSGKLNQFANTSSSELSSIITDETGTGLLVFNSSPTLTGIPLVPTATSGTNTNQIASTAFVRTEVSNLVASAPSTLDTLNELASALGNDANFSTTVTNSLASKANLSGAVFTGSISSPSGNFTQNLQFNGTGVSISGHTHIASNISDSTAAGRALLTGADAAAQRTSLGLGSIATLSSGTYALSSHTHTSSDITNFNSSVSGLLPVNNITAGSGISISASSGNYTINVDVIDCGQILAPPNAPTALSATSSNASLVLSWTAPTYAGSTAITGYTVEYTPSGGSPSTINTNSASTSYTLSGLTNGISYSVRVRAINSIGNGSYSSSVSSIPSIAGLTVLSALSNAGSYTGAGTLASPISWSGNYQAGQSNIFTVNSNGTLYINVTNELKIPGDYNEGAIWYKNNTTIYSSYYSARSYNFSTPVNTNDTIKLFFELSYGGGVKAFTAYVS